MGRYYSGDIEGKFWFGVQSSDAAERFGVYGDYPPYMEYSFSMDDLEGVEAELTRIENNLGENMAILDKFFDINNGYNNDMIIDFYKKEYNKKISNSKVMEYLSEYADYLFGVEIRDCLKENGYCSFTAEL